MNTKLYIIGLGIIILTAFVCFYIKHERVEYYGRGALYSLCVADHYRDGKIPLEVCNEIFNKGIHITDKYKQQITDTEFKHSTTVKLGNELCQFINGELVKLIKLK